jgi:hypothetical protein
MKNTPIKAALVTPVPTFFVAILLGVALVGANAAESSDQESQTEKLAKETQNPVANLISVPFQNNFNFGIGPNDATQWVLNIQPVIPITLNKDWNLITRTIVPLSTNRLLPPEFGARLDSVTLTPACSSRRPILAN